MILMVLFISTRSGTVEIPLEREDDGVYMLPVRINGTITKKFILDTGASEVSIPSDIFLQLLRSGTVTVEDILPGDTYELADGKSVWNPRVNIRRLEVGGCIVEDVPVSIDSPNSSLLLGQSFLSRLPSWKLDNEDEKLIVEKTFDKTVKKNDMWL
jgi:clan AA aspartic protease (TIGR02281 family)